MPETATTPPVLQQALLRYSQIEIASLLDVNVRQVRRWIVGESQPRSAYLSLLQKELAPEPILRQSGFQFVDLFAGIGGLRRGFERMGGECVFTSEWDRHSVKTYSENFPDGHDIWGDITQIAPTAVSPTMRSTSAFGT